MNINVNPRTLRARELRRSPNAAERALWSMLRSRRLGGFKFVRQMPVGPYFAGFMCRSRGVVIDVDEADRTRDEYMLRAGYAVFHVPSSSVLQDREGVCASILAVLEERVEEFVSHRIAGGGSPS